jgi:hypothetical protein
LVAPDSEESLRALCEFPNHFTGGPTEVEIAWRAYDRIQQQIELSSLRARMADRYEAHGETAASFGPACRRRRVL